MPARSNEQSLCRGPSRVPKRLLGNLGGVQGCGREVGKLNVYPMGWARTTKREESRKVPKMKDMTSTRFELGWCFSNAVRRPLILYQQLLVSATAPEQLCLFGFPPPPPMETPLSLSGTLHNSITSFQREHLTWTKSRFVFFMVLVIRLGHVRYDQYFEAIGILAHTCKPLAGN